MDSSAGSRSAGCEGSSQESFMGIPSEQVMCPLQAKERGYDPAHGM